jgi:hypothetical protein
LNCPFPSEFIIDASTPSPEVPLIKPKLLIDLLTIYFSIKLK